MITYGIVGVKTALLALVDQASIAIFTTASQIYTGFPNPDMLRPPVPEVGKPVVAVHFHADDVQRLGYRRLMERVDEDVAVPGGTEHHRRDVFAVLEQALKADIYVFAATPDELVGTKTPGWSGYVEQVELIVAARALIVGPRDTAIKWDVVGVDIPGVVADMQDRRLHLSVVNTVLLGQLLAPAVDGAQIDHFVPHDGHFVLTGF